MLHKALSIENSFDELVVGHRIHICQQLFLLLSLVFCLTYRALEFKRKTSLKQVFDSIQQKSTSLLSDWGYDMLINDP